MVKTVGVPPSQIRTCNWSPAPIRLKSKSGPVEKDAGKVEWMASSAGRVAAVSGTR